MREVEHVNSMQWPMPGNGFAKWRLRTVGNLRDFDDRHLAQRLALRMSKPFFPSESAAGRQSGLRHCLFIRGVVEPEATRG